jgi:cytidine deaminase
MLCDHDDDDDHSLIRLAHQHRLKLTPPSQSNFRVVAILCYEVTESNNQNDESAQRNATTTTVDRFSGALSSRNYDYVIGTNGEPGGNISGSICAERSAMLQLRFVPNVRRITKLVISTDARYPTAPGMMCREFLSGHIHVPLDLPIVLAGSVCQVCALNISFPQKSAVVSPRPDESSLAALHASCQPPTIMDDDERKDGSLNKFHSFKVLRTTLKQLYPFPSLYARLTASEATQLGGALYLKTNKSKVNRHPRGDDDDDEDDAKTGTGDGKRSSSPSDSIKFTALVELATRKARRQHERDRVDRPEFLHHPITFGAAVLFDDGTMAAAAQKKALEYGCTLDAVCQLAHAIDNDDHDWMSSGHSKRTAVLLVQVDQYGVVHAPFAPARAFLLEHGHGQCRVILQSQAESDDGPNFIQVLASELAPLVPDNSCYS